MLSAMIGDLATRAFLALLTALLFCVHFCAWSVLVLIPLLLVPAGATPGVVLLANALAAALIANVASLFASRGTCREPWCLGGRWVCFAVALGLFLAASFAAGTRLQAVLWLPAPLLVFLGGDWGERVRRREAGQALEEDDPTGCPCGQGAE